MSITYRSPNLFDSAPLNQHVSFFESALLFPSHTRTFLKIDCNCWPSVAANRGIDKIRDSTAIKYLGVILFMCFWILIAGMGVTLSG